jgi:hypothetical protein
MIMNSVGGICMEKYMHAYNRLLYNPGRNKHSTVIKIKLKAKEHIIPHTRRVVKD